MRKTSFIGEKENLAKESLGEKLETIIEQMSPAEVTLIEILDIIGNDSLMLITIFLSLVFLVPVSIPGVSTVFGSAILLIGFSLLLSRKLWLPKRISARRISTDKLVVVLNRALLWFRRLERISHPHRLQWLTTGGKISLFNKLSFILAAVLLMMPFGFIPFSNTIPAIALILLSVGLMQKDGGFILLGYLANLATIIYFTALVAGGGLTIYEALRFFSG